MAGLSFGLVKAYAQGQELPVLTPAELLAQVAGVAESDLSVSGDFTITNDLLGPLSALNLGGGAAWAACSQGGSGRLWVQDGKARVDVFGRLGNDMSVYFDGKTVTVYDAAENTLTEYTLPGRRYRAGPATATPAHPAGPPGSADLHRRRAGEAGPDGRSGRDRAGVGGRASCYLLTLTPEL